LLSGILADVFEMFMFENRLLQVAWSPRSPTEIPQPSPATVSLTCGR